MARQGFCDCCDTYRPLHHYDSYATGETWACDACSWDGPKAYHKRARFGRGFIPELAIENWVCKLTKIDPATMYC